MRFENLEKYHGSFFSAEKLQNYQHNHWEFINEIKRRCDYLLSGEIVFTDSLDMEAEAKPFKLSYENLVNSPNEDPEWIYMVSRNGYLVDLAIMYQLTQDKKYLVKWQELLLSFLEWSKMDNQHLWRNLDVGLRLSNWLKCSLYLGDFTKFFSENDQEKILQSIKEHVSYLKSSFVEKNYLSNWGVLAVTGLLNAAQLVPELVEETDCVWAWNVLQEEMRLQFYQDGIHWEQSPMYHHEVIMSVLQLWINQHYVKCFFPEEIVPYLKKAIKASYYYCNHSNQLLALHDSDPVDFSYIYSIYQLCGFLPLEKENDLGYLYVGEKIHFQTHEILPPTFSELDSGFMAYKSKNNYFSFFNGRHGSGHGHGSLGSVTVSLKGEELIVDPGRHTYQEEKSRVQLKSEKSHSSLIVDNSPITIIKDSWSYETIGNPLSSKTIDDKNYTQFVGTWSGIAGNSLALFKRNLVFFKEDSILLVINQVESLGQHQLTTSYQIAPELEVVLGYDIFLKNSSYAIFYNLGQEVSCEEGLFSEKYNELKKHPVLSLKNSFVDKCVTYEVFYNNKNYQIKSLNCYQNKVTSPCNKEEYFGIQVKNISSKESFEYYYSGFDTFKGDKLYQSETGKKLYGENVFFKNKGDYVK